MFPVGAEISKSMQKLVVRENETAGNWFDFYDGKNDANLRWFIFVWLIYMYS